MASDDFTRTLVELVQQNPGATGAVAGAAGGIASTLGVLALFRTVKKIFKWPRPTYAHDVLTEALALLKLQGRGLPVQSYGRSRDGFRLPIAVPNWLSGYGGQYEMHHKNIPAGAMIAITHIEALDVTDIEKLKSQLAKLDAYPTGHSGDFSEIKVADLDAWWTQNNRLDSRVNPQAPIQHVKQLTSEGLGFGAYNDLVSHLVQHMEIFKVPGSPNQQVPADPAHRKMIVESILLGLSQTTRYTRQDGPATVFEIVGDFSVQKSRADGGGSIDLKLTSLPKLLILRTAKGGKKDITPLDRAMVGEAGHTTSTHTYIVPDGKPMGDRALVSVQQIEDAINRVQAANPLRYRMMGWVRPVALKF